MPIYMKFDGVDGDVTAEAYKNWINLQSATWGSSRNVTTAGAGSDRSRSAVQMRELVITKERDHASGKLWREHLKGDAPVAVTLVWTTTSQGGEMKYQEVNLSDVLVSAFASAGHSDARPLEQLSLNFTSIEGVFYDVAHTGTVASKPFRHTYVIAAGK